MPERSRLQYSIINSVTAVTIQVVNIFVKFAIQTVLIKKMGSTYVGINGLFTNILMMLSFAELGVGSAIVYALYKPIAEDNKREISALMSLFRKAYITIGVIVGVMGLILLPFLNLIVKHGSQIHDLKWYFTLFLVNSVISYFFSYKRSLLIADQKNYVSMLNQFIFNLIQAFLQIPLLLTTENYILFLIVQILCTLTSNVLISNRVDKDYKYIKVYKNEKVPGQVLQKIKKNIVGMIGSKIGTIAVFGTDNILISSFLGIVQVGLYSNYSMIATAVTNILSNAVNSMTASIGNLTVTGKREQVKSIFLKHLFLNFVLTLGSSTLLMSMIQPFIRIWVGQKYLLSDFTVEIIVVNFLLNQMRQTALTFISSYGLFWKVGVKSIVEALTNLILSFILIFFFKLGIAGTLLGTILTNLIINSWWEPRLVIKYGLKFNVNEYYYHYVGYILIILLNINFVWYVTSAFSMGGIAEIALAALISLFCNFLTVFVLFHQSSEYKYMIGILRAIVARK